MLDPIELLPLNFSPDTPYLLLLLWWWQGPSFLVFPVLWPLPLPILFIEMGMSDNGWGFLAASGFQARTQ